jgi:hypothetical protein
MDIKRRQTVQLLSSALPTNNKLSFYKFADSSSFTVFSFNIRRDDNKLLKYIVPELKSRLFAPCTVLVCSTKFFTDSWRRRLNTLVRKNFFPQFQPTNAHNFHFIHNCTSKYLEALCYKPEGRGFDARWCQWNFLLT